MEVNVINIILAILEPIYMYYSTGVITIIFSVLAFVGFFVELAFVILILSQTKGLINCSNSS